MNGHRNRVIVAGGGDDGLELAMALHDRGHSVSIVERDAERCEQLNDRWIATVIEGDATDPAVLAQAAPESADALVAVTGDPARNLVVCRMARELEVPVAFAVDDGSLGDVPIERVEILPHPPNGQSLYNAVVERLRTI